MGGKCQRGVKSFMARHINVPGHVCGEGTVLGCVREGSKHHGGFPFFCSGGSDGVSVRRPENEIFLAKKIQKHRKRFVCPEQFTKLRYGFWYRDMQVA